MTINSLWQDSDKESRSTQKESKRDTNRLASGLIDIPIGGSVH
jgi:hypothetical protein